MTKQLDKQEVLKNWKDSVADLDLSDGDYEAVEYLIWLVIEAKDAEAQQERLKDKERLLDGMDKLWNKRTPLVQSILPDGRVQIEQKTPFHVTEASLEEIKDLINKVYDQETNY